MGGDPRAMRKPSASIEAESLGLRFLFDSHQRAVTPTLARLRRRGSESWGLHGMHFKIGPGEGVALIGPSGSGKTSLLRLMSAFCLPTPGAWR